VPLRLTGSQSTLLFALILALRPTIRLSASVAAEPRLLVTALQTVGSKGYDGFALVVGDRGNMAFPPLGAPTQTTGGMSYCWLRLKNDAAEVSLRHHYLKASLY